MLRERRFGLTVMPKLEPCAWAKARHVHDTRRYTECGLQAVSTDCAYAAYDGLGRGWEFSGGHADLDIDAKELNDGNLGFRYTWVNAVKAHSFMTTLPFRFRVVNYIIIPLTDNSTGRYHDVLQPVTTIMERPEYFATSPELYSILPVNGLGQWMMQNYPLVARSELYEGQMIGAKRLKQYQWGCLKYPELLSRGLFEMYHDQSKEFADADSRGKKTSARNYLIKLGWYTWNFSEKTFLFLVSLWRGN
jgi:hypothetical protein